MRVDATRTGKNDRNGLTGLCRRPVFGCPDRDAEANAAHRWIEFVGGLAVARAAGLRDR